MKDIRQLDLQKLSSRGITGVVIDKDNCLVRHYTVTNIQTYKLLWLMDFLLADQTKPLRDAVVPELTVRVAHLHLPMQRLIL